MTVRLCTVEYSSSAVETEATLVEINFSEECRSQMVSVFSQIGEPSKIFLSIIWGFPKWRFFTFTFMVAVCHCAGYLLVFLLLHFYFYFLFTLFNLNFIQVTVCQPVQSHPEYGHHEGEHLKWHCMMIMSMRY